MPYIRPRDRVELNTMQREPANAGELNYMLTRVCLAYVARGELNYQAINDVIGALEGAKQEFYRRLAVPYEEFKSGVNGDVYPEVESHDKPLPFGQVFDTIAPHDD